MSVFFIAIPGTYSSYGKVLIKNECIILGVQKTTTLDHCNQFASVFSYQSMADIYTISDIQSVYFNLSVS